MNKLPRRHRIGSGVWMVVAAGGVVFLLAGPPLAEALNEWTAQLTQMTVTQYPPGYGNPDTY